MVENLGNYRLFLIVSTTKFRRALLTSYENPRLEMVIALLCLESPNRISIVRLRRTASIRIRSFSLRGGGSPAFHTYLG